MTAPRLPVPGGDDNEWGDILNQFLLVAHQDDGTLRSESFTGAGLLQSSNNLSDVQSLPGARTNLGLGNVDNTADADKPVSAAQQTALDGKVSKAGDTMTGSLTVDGNLTVGGTFLAPSPVITMIIHPQAGSGAVQKDVPLYQRLDGTWYVSETLQTLPFSTSSSVVSLGFETAQMPFNSYDIQIIACGMTVTSLDGQQIFTVSVSAPIPIDSTYVGSNPVEWQNVVETLGDQLSLETGVANTTVITNTQNIFQVSAWVNATILYSPDPFGN